MQNSLSRKNDCAHAVNQIHNMNHFIHARKHSFVVTLYPNDSNPFLHNGHPGPWNKMRKATRTLPV